MCFRPWWCRWKHQNVMCLVIKQNNIATVKAEWSVWVWILVWKSHISRKWWKRQAVTTVQRSWQKKNNRNDRKISQRAKREKKTIHILPFSYSKSCFYNHVVLHTKSFSAELIIHFLPLFRLPLFSSHFAMCPMGPMSFICSLPAPFITLYNIWFRQGWYPLSSPICIISK